MDKRGLLHSRVMEFYLVAKNEQANPRINIYRSQKLDFEQKKQSAEGHVYNNIFNAKTVLYINTYICSGGIKS